MSQPRRVLPGATHLVTRRCADRRFYLRPDHDVGLIFVFCLALAALVSGVQVHAWCVMSNHVHVVVTDTRGELPIFLHRLGRNVAMAVKVLRGIRENVWSTDAPSVVELVTPEAVLDAMLYVLVQAVDAGIVHHPDEWIGSHPAMRFFDGRPRAYKRPRVWFRAKSPLATEVELRVTMPEALRAIGFMPERFEKDMTRLVDGRAKDLVVAARAEGRRCSGIASALAVSAFDSPATFEPARGRNPSLKASAPTALREAIACLRSFRARYRAALLSLRKREPALFPLGTWLLRRIAGVTVAPT